MSFTASFSCRLSNGLLPALTLLLAAGCASSKTDLLSEYLNRKSPVAANDIRSSELEQQWNASQRDSDASNARLASHRMQSESTESESSQPSPSTKREPELPAPTTAQVDDGGTGPETLPRPPAELPPPTGDSSELLPAPSPLDPDGLAGKVSIDDVIQSIRSTYPLVAAAYQDIRIAAGNQLAAWGQFDTKLKANSENRPLGFYETYRNDVGFVQPLYEGGEVFGGYRIGRGSFPPWYLERQTNDGGEFKAGFNVPLLRNRNIDERRAALWKATYELQQAEPEVLAQLIVFIRDGSLVYWDWIAAGQQYEIAQQALELAQQRNANLRRRVETGDLDPPVLQDNLRAIADREAKLIALRRKLQESAVKLSLFLRNASGLPVVPDPTKLVEFPNPEPIETFDVDQALAVALQNRPELAALEAKANQINVELAEARNDLLPDLNAQLVGGQDVGEPTSPKRDKSELEIEAGLFFEVPLQRRKAQGKIAATRAKLLQLDAKRQFTVDKIQAEVQTAFVALNAAYERLEKARESQRLAEYIADVERRKFELGDSDLLSVVLREQLAIEAAEATVAALLEYHSAKANYDAARGIIEP